MKPRILLTGKNGQVGSELLHLLPRVGEVIALIATQLDLAKPEDIRRIIREIRPNLIVNAAAYTAVDQAEKRKKLCPSYQCRCAGTSGAGSKKDTAQVSSITRRTMFSMA